MPGSESTTPSFVTDPKGLAPGLPGVWGTALATLLIAILLGGLLILVLGTMDGDGEES